MQKKKNILITGGAGFIGSRLAIKLLAQNNHVTVLDNLSPQIHGSNPEENSPLYQSILSKVNFIKGDITNREDLEKSIDNQDVIVHFAAETGTGQSMYSVAHYTKVNSFGTALLMDVLMSKPNDVKKIILASSRAIYGEGKYQHDNLGEMYPEHRKLEHLEQGIFEILHEDGSLLKPLPTDENSKIHPSSIYGITKYNQEEIIKTIAPLLGISYLHLRYQNVYGEGQSLRNPYTGILSIFSTQIMNNREINIFEDGKPSRDFIHVDDVVEATIKAIETQTVENAAINIGTGISTNVLTVAETLCELYQKEAKLSVTGDFRVGDIRHNIADTEKMNSLLNFKPKVVFNEGITKFANWVSQQIIEDNHYQNSIKELRAKGIMK